MAETSYFRTHLQSQLVHGSQTLLKPTLQHIYLNFSVNLGEIELETSPLVISEILGLFGNTLTSDRVFSRHR